jgi:hypothetical protein
MYRDALLQVPDEDLGDARRCVEAAFLLTPQRLQPLKPSWRAETTPMVFFRKEYRDTFRFGAISVRPGASILDFQRVLAALLSSPRQPASP